MKGVSGVIELSDPQMQAKEAIKDIQSNEDRLLALFYETHREYNAKFFEGKLSLPIISVEKLNNKTLGSFQERNDLNLDFHIKINSRMIELNTDTVILNTLKHEMIHQWQAEILYTPHGIKKRPKCWHNTDFDFKAKDIGCVFPNPDAVMPPSRNKPRIKYRCDCIDDSTYKPLIISLPWELDAVCNNCGKTFIPLE